MRKVLLAAVCTACVALVAPALAGAAIQAPNVVQGNDYGVRGAVVNYALPTTADEGALVGPTFCLPASGTVFPVGTTAVGCTSFIDGGTTCVFGICFPNPDIPVSGGFNVTVNIVRCTLSGDGVSNALAGTSARDWICGLGGIDVINGAGGPDTLDGGGGGDTITGGGGRDAVKGGTGGDTLRVRDGLRDTVNCGTGSDLVIADSRDSVASNCERVRRG
jgi:Ca2+-binding RTX toxin-like protein